MILDAAKTAVVEKLPAKANTEIRFSNGIHWVVDTRKFPVNGNSIFLSRTGLSRHADPVKGLSNSMPYEATTRYYLRSLENGKLNLGLGKHNSSARCNGLGKCNFAMHYDSVHKRYMRHPKATDVQLSLISANSLSDQEIGQREQLDSKFRRLLKREGWSGIRRIQLRRVANGIPVDPALLMLGIGRK